MNGDFRDILSFLIQIKKGVKARWVAFEYAPYGMKIRVDWDDNCHCIYALGEEQIQSANYTILNFLVEYFNSEHERVKSK